jgi:excisionase family DNA binding protein
VLVDHAAEILGVSRRTVYYRIREGRLRTVRTRGGSQRVLLESIEALLRDEEAKKEEKKEKRRAARKASEPNAAAAPRLAPARTTTGTAGVLSTDLFGKSRVLWQQR